jgi:hypothetical protein
VFFTNSGGVYDCSVDTPQTEEFTRMQVREKHLAPGGAACGIESTTLLRGRGHFLTFTDDDLSRQARDKNCNRNNSLKKGVLFGYTQLCQLEELYSEYEFSEVNKNHIYYYY